MLKTFYAKVNGNVIKYKYLCTINKDDHIYKAVKNISHKKGYIPVMARQIIFFSKTKKEIHEILLTINSISEDCHYNYHLWTDKVGEVSGLKEFKYLPEAKEDKAALLLAEI